MESYDILGCPCHALADEAEAAACLERLVAEKQGGYSVAINAEKIYRYSHDPALARAIRGAAIFVPDGSGAVLSLRLLHRRRAARINFPRVALAVANRNRYRLALFGATPENNALAVAEIKGAYPGIKLVSCLDGYHGDEAMIDRLRESPVDMVLLGLGSPKQEVFAARLRSDVPEPFVVCCGGAINVLAGKARKAPAVFADNHLEWLYRLAREPSRCKRQRLLPLFLARLLFAVLKRHTGASAFFL